MKKIFQALVVSLFLFSSTIFSQSVQDGLIAYYPFNGNANDVSGNNHNGILNGDITPCDDLNENANRAFIFDGVDDYVEIENAVGFDSTDNITIALWVKKIGKGCLISKADPHSHGYWLSVNSDGFLEYCTSGFWYHNTTGINISSNEWNHIALVRDETKVQIYFNGDLELTQELAWSDMIDDDEIDISIGRHTPTNYTGPEPSPGYENFFHGCIDDVYFFNKALSAEEISDILNKNIPINDDFEDGNYDGWTLVDGTAQVTTENPCNGNYSLKISDSTPNGGGKVMRNFSPEDTIITVEYSHWVNSFGFNDGAGVKLWSGDTRFITVAQQVYTEGYFRYIDSTDVSWNTAKDFPNKPQITEQTWYKVKLVCNAITGEVNLWIDDVDQGTVTVPSKGFIDGISFGCGWSSPTTAYCYVDDVRIYKYIESALPISDDFEDGNYDGWTLADGTTQVTTEKSYNGNYSLKISDSTPTGGGKVTRSFSPEDDIITVEYSHWVNSFGWNDGAGVKLWSGDTRFITVAQQFYTEGYFRYIDSTDVSWETAKDFPNKPQITEQTWYKVKLKCNPITGEVNLWIDDVDQGTVTVPSKGFIDGISFCCGWSCPTSAYCYVDDVRIYRESEQQIPIFPIASSPQTPGSEFWVEIQVGSSSNPVTDLFGVSFVLSYSNTNFIDYVSSEAGSFLGSDVVFMPTPDDPNGKVAIGITKKSGAGGVNGDGVVARIKLKISDLTPDSTQITFTIKDVNANDPNSLPISLSPGSANITIVGLLVWPGDTNDDGIVNQADILPIGLYWHSTGSSRTDASMNWIGQTCSPWTPEKATYADATGDGIVNQNDILPIGLNWGKTHTLLTAPEFQEPVYQLSKTNSATLKINITGNTKQNSWCWVEFVAENVTNLFGISFEMEYSPISFIDSVKAETESWLGEDIIFYPTIDMNNGKVSFGISRKAGQGGVRGSGVVAQLRIKLKDISPIETNLTLSNVYANDDQGNQIQFGVESYVITAIDDVDLNSIPSSYSIKQNYPNPFNPTTNINYQLPKTDHVKLEIFNLQGQKIRTLVNEDKSAGVYNIFWDGKNNNGKSMVSGTYIYRITTSDFHQSKKMILLK